MTSFKENINYDLINGDENTYIKLFREYYVCLCAYSRKYVGRKEIAEEIVTDIFYWLWKNKKDLKINTSIRSYLFKCAYNNSIQYLRNLEREKKIGDYFSDNELGNLEFSFSPEETSEKSILKEDFYEKMEAAIKNLPPQQQEAFRLKRFEGMKNKEIADIMGIAVKTVEMHLAQAMFKLRAELKSSAGDFIFLLLIKSFR